MEKEKIEKLHERWKAKMDSMPIDSSLFNYNSGIECGLGLALGTYNKPTWQDQPTEDGYYWHIDYPEDKPSIIWVHNNRGGQKVASFPGDGEDLSLCIVYGKWYGPIIPPKEA